MSENGVQNIKILLCHPTPRFRQLHKGVARFSTVVDRLVTHLIEKTGRRGLPKNQSIDGRHSVRPKALKRLE